MDEAFRAMPDITRRVRERGCVLMLDFDGTLSPLVRQPDDAVISAKTRKLLERAAELFPVAIISGRPLTDIRSRVGIPGIAYAGDHGYTWCLGTRTFRRTMPRTTAQALGSARPALISVATDYAALVREDKAAGIAFNYRALTPRQARRFREAACRAIAPYARRGGVRCIDALQTFEIVADARWTKGECARLLFSALDTQPRGRAPIFIGDSLTDEDAFREFRKGITVRVGKSETSRARYYLKKRTDVDRFLHVLTHELPRASRVTASTVRRSKRHQLR